jgi:hypothetical protein
MRQRRKLGRRHLLLYLQVLNRDTGETLGRMGDVTTDGMMLISNAAAEVGTVQRVRIILPEEAYPDKTLDLDAQCLWCRRDRNPELMVCGLRFLDVGEEARLTIEDLVREYGFLDGQSGLGAG